jgi:hypothetical protein
VIDKRSRYARVGTVTVPGPDGRPRVLIELREPPRIDGVLRHAPEPGERLDHLAHRFYRDPRRFWRICDASDELDPFEVVVPGDPLLIPPDS